MWQGAKRVLRWIVRTDTAIGVGGVVIWLIVLALAVSATRSDKSRGTWLPSPSLSIASRDSDRGSEIDTSRLFDPETAAAIGL